jgi:hypothetical protein
MEENMKFVDPNNICFTEALNLQDQAEPAEFVDNCKDSIEYKNHSNNEIKQLTAARQFAKSIKIGYLNNKAYVEIEPAKKGDKGGCRAIGLILSALIDHSIKIKTKMPGIVYLKSLNGFQPRALLTLKYISDQNNRKLFKKSFDCIKVSEIVKIDKMNANQFETAVRKGFNKKYKCNCLKDEKLKLPGTGNAKETDGIEIKDGRITIIEIKNMEINFTEGVTELIQNYGIVKEYIDYAMNDKKLIRLNDALSKIKLNPSLEIDTWLLFSKDPKDHKKATLFENIMEFLGSSQKISFRVAL